MIKGFKAWLFIILAATVVALGLGGIIGIMTMAAMGIVGEFLESLFPSLKGLTLLYFAIVGIGLLCLWANARWLEIGKQGQLPSDFEIPK